jgi:nitrite reductase (NADH) small subunit
MKHRLFKRDELKPGEKKVVVLNNKSILVVCKSEGEIYAVRNKCPHQGAPLDKGSFNGTVVCNIAGEYKYGRENEIIRCPWHGFEFEANTGCAVHDKNDKKMKTYPVYIEDENVIIEV